MENAIARFLSAVEPFKRLAPSDRERLAAGATEKSYAKGDTIFREGQPSDAVWVVKTGRVHMMNFLPNGKASATCVLGPGELFCCLPAMDRGAYPGNAMAAASTVVVRISAAAFHQTMGRHAAFAQSALCVFGDRLRGVEQKGCMVYESADIRLAQALLGLAKKFGDTIPLTRQELAEITGLTHETAIRTLSQFKRDGLIRSSRGQLTLLQPEKLRDLAGL